MKVIVLGAGVIGVTSAYYLAKAGHEVTVIDRQPGPALETSYANAGEVSPGYASPWAGPGVPRKAINWLMMRHPPLIIKPTADPRMALWLLRMLGNCNAQSYATNKARMVRVAEYRRDVMRQLRADTGIAYDERMQGTLQLFSKQKQIDEAVKDTAILDEHGVPYEVLTPAGCIKAEPGLVHASEAAQTLLKQSGKWSWLKAWGMRVAQRRGLRRAIVAVARRLAAILHRMWTDGTDFRWGSEPAAAAA